MANQLFEDGKVITVDGIELECTSVGYLESNGERHTFSYTFRVKSELDAEREAIRKAEEEGAEALRQHEENQAEQVTNNPPAPQEETQHVR